LVAKTLAGDRESFAILYDRYARLVRAVVWDVARDWSMTHDLTQESFLRAYRNLRRLNDPSRFGAWIVGIARQVVRERRRSLRRDRHQFRGESLEVSSECIDVDGAADADEFEFIMSKVATLEERERLAIHAFFLDGRDARQVAEQLGLSRSGLYALVARAVARLAALVRPQELNKETEP
jgi:RNA polymerase sigma-70 factor (ECF subfamily)